MHTATRALSNLRKTRGLLGAAPFFLFLTAFLVIPVIANTAVAFSDANQQFTTANLTEAIQEPYTEAFLLSTQLSLVTAAIGTLGGIALAWALTFTPKTGKLAALVNSFAALASQAGGVTLAYAFIALLGAQGFITQLLPQLFTDFSLTSFWGITIVYSYFQIPLMTILMLPALAGMQNTWYTAAISLGATKTQFLRDIALPILWPAIAGSFLLLFANAFAAYATVYALTGGSINLVALVVGFLISGNVLLNPALAAALITWMIVIICATLGIRFYLTRRSKQWLHG